MLIIFQRLALLREPIMAGPSRARLNTPGVSFQGLEKFFQDILSNYS